MLLYLKAQPLYYSMSVSPSANWSYAYEETELFEAMGIVLEKWTVDHALLLTWKI